VIVYCDPHALAHGIVRRNPVGGFIEYRFRDPKFRDRMRDEVFDGHDTAWFNLEGTNRSTVRSLGCRDCCVRDLPVDVMIDAFKEGQAKLAL
jgi:hypothetical protein